MAPLASVDTTVNNRTYDYTEKDAFDALYQELAKGVQSMKMVRYTPLKKHGRKSTRYSIWINLKKYKIVLSKDACARY